jgi:hypothetical protein
MLRPAVHQSPPPAPKPVAAPKLAKVETPVQKVEPVSEPKAVKPEASANSENAAGSSRKSGDKAALTPISDPPKFTSKEEHANITSTTPASFSDIPPILNFQQEDVKIEFDPAFQGQSEMKGKLWVTEA